MGEASILSSILAKLLLLDTNCKYIFVLSLVTAETIFFQELTCNFKPQSQASVRHVVDEFLNEAAFHRERPFPELFKNKILRNLFNVHSLKYCDSVKRSN